VHHAESGRVVILECEVHGTILATGVPYHNRLPSVITIADRKIVHWRDYMDSLAAWNALTAPSLIWCSSNKKVRTHHVCAARDHRIVK
jgi:ketosteroid isomerase-like protein